ncbi:KH domain-containing protein [Candidatus Microgenomates bacterium]|nr:KH domain-containing protein [Candidatus Microgenomates bacterium]
MKDLLSYIVTNLVTKPEAITIDEQKDNGNINLTLTVDPADMGLIIGKGGQTIRSIRKLLTVRAIAENVRVNLQLTEPSQEIATSSDKSDSSQ